MKKSEGANNDNQDFIFQQMKKWKELAEQRAIIISLLNKEIKSLIK